MPLVLIAHPSPDLYGSDRVMLETVSALVEHDWTVVVTLPVPGPLVSEIEVRGAQVLYCPTPVLRKSGLAPLGLIRTLRDVLISVGPAVRLLRTTRPDVLYVSTVTIPLWLLVARVLGVPSIAHIHEAERQIAPTIRRLMAAQLFLANELLVNSVFNKAVLAESFAALARRCTVVLNAVPGPSRVEPARGQLQGPVRLLFVGRLSPRKGPQLAIDVVDDLRERGVRATLDIVGSVYAGYEWFEAELRERLRDKSLTDCVSFRGFQHDIWADVASADVVLVPAQSDEAFGNTAVEAVLAARPVIVSSTSGLLEAVDGYRSSQTADPSDLSAWTDAIMRVQEDWDVYRAAAFEDSKRAGERHSPDAYRDHVFAKVSGLLSAAAA